MAKFLILALTLWMGLITFRDWRTWYLLHEFGVSTGTQVIRRYECGGEIPAYCLDYRFQVIGRTSRPEVFTSKSSALSHAEYERLPPGAQLTVRYFPGDPSISEIAQAPWAFTMLKPLLETFMETILCATLLALFIRGRRRSRSRFQAQ